MNAHPKSLTGHPTDTLHGIALGIQLGHLPKADAPYYEDADWASAADELLHEDNPFDLDHMLAREEAYGRFVEWQRRNPCREDDFGNWLADAAAWNGGIYARAQTNAERRG